MFASSALRPRPASPAKEPGQGRWFHSRYLPLSLRRVRGAPDSDKAGSLPIAAGLCLIALRLLLPAALADEKPGEPKGPPAPESTTGSLPFPLDREHRYSWFQGRQKVGETSFRLSLVDAPGGGPRRLYRSTSRFRYEREGLTLSGDCVSFFDPSLRPVRYQTQSRYSGVRNYHSENLQEGEVQGTKLRYAVVHNGETAQPVRREMEMPPGSYLWLNQAVDNIALLCGDLLKRPTDYDVKVVYPDFLRVYEIHFVFEKEEPVEVGGKSVSCRRFSFRSKEGQLDGRVFMDERGRLVQYEQGPLRIVLES
jgi:hypothetical protein